MNTIKVLDVTLRDGGCVNDFNFGTTYMEKILSAQEHSGIDIIELGYLDSTRGTESGRTQYVSEKVIPKCILKNKKPDTMYVAMMDYGKYDVEKLGNYCPEGIDGIRLAFHKKNRFDVIPLCRKIIDKGYKLFIQPMVTLRYSDAELLEFIQRVNCDLSDAAGLYIVDSFGEMRANDMSRILNLVDHNLIASMDIGLHSHNNLQMSYSNAVAMLQFPTNRNIIIDCSIMGMGKGAGNLNTELLLEHLNLYYGKGYNIAPLLEVMDQVINQLHAEYYWGYAPEYYLSAVNQCTPSYASYFYGKHMLSIDQVAELLGLMNPEKKNSFDKNYAEEIYRSYNETKSVNDSQAVNELKNELFGKSILLVAPGKSVISEERKIQTIANQEQVITIGINTIFEFHDYVLATRKDVYESAVEQGKNVVVASNVSKEEREKVRILNYANWIEVDDKTHDSSAVIALKLLQYCGVKEVMLAGFDGFSININENYFDPNMRHPMNVKQAEEANHFFMDFVKKMKSEGMKISFVTESMFDCVE